MADALLEPGIKPARRDILTRFTRENAREKGIKGAQAAAIAREQRRKAQEEQARLALEPKPAPKPAQSTPELELVEEQIARAREVLNDSGGYCPACERGGLEPHHRAQLLKALDALLDRKRELLGIPRAGSRRPAPEKSTQGRAASLLKPSQPQAKPGHGQEQE